MVRVQTGSVQQAQGAGSCPIAVRVPKVLLPDRYLVLIGPVLIGPVLMGLVLIGPVMTGLALAIALAVRAVVVSALEVRAVVVSGAVVPLGIVPPPAVPHRTAAAWTVTGLPVSNGWCVGLRRRTSLKR